MIYAVPHLGLCGAGLAHVRLQVRLGKPRLQCMRSASRMRAWTQHANWRRAWTRQMCERLAFGRNTDTLLCNTCFGARQSTRARAEVGCEHRSTYAANANASSGSQRGACACAWMG